jgi:hypothetical protein
MQRRARLARWEDNLTQATSAPSPEPWDTAIVTVELAAARCPSSRCPAIRSSRRPSRNSADCTGTWVRPQIPGFSPGGLGPHLTASGFPSGLSSGFPFAHPGSSPSSAFLWFPFVRRSPVRSLRPSLSGSVPVGFPPVPFPLSNLHVSAAARRFCRRWSRAAGTKVTSSRRDPRTRSRELPMDLPMGNPGNPGCESGTTRYRGDQRRSGSLRSRAAAYGSAPGTAGAAPYRREKWQRYRP